MIITILNAIPEEQLARIDELIPSLEFVDGRATAIGGAAKVKNNHQAKQGDALQEIRTLAAQALERNEAFNSFSVPLRMMPAIINRYEPGMSYGDHIDLPVMHGPPRVRTDLAMTLFLSDPASYEGGELVISSDFGAQKVKLPKGGLVLYPATTTHRVEPVTLGARVGLVSWIQSMVRDHEKRLLLAELARVQRWARSQDETAPAVLQIQKVRANLLRMWADV